MRKIVAVLLLALVALPAAAGGRRHVVTPPETPSWRVAEWPLAHAGAFGTDLVNFVNGNPVLNFEQPQTRTRVTYGAAAWSGDAWVRGSAAKLNDGDLTSTAVTVTLGGNFLLDLGTPKSLREARVYIAPDTVTPHRVSVAWADTPGGFHKVNGSASLIQQWTGQIGATEGDVVAQWPNVGAHRYWNFNLDGAGATVDVREIQVYEYAGTYADALVFLVYDTSSGQPVLVGSFPAHGRDYVADPIPLLGLVKIDTKDGYDSASLRVTTVNEFGIQSLPLETAARWHHR